MKLTDDEIVVEDMMAEMTGEFTSVYVDRSYRVAASYSAKVPDYILRQGVISMDYDNGNLLIRTRTKNSYELKLTGLGTPQYLDERSIHVEEWDTQKVIYED